MHPWASKQKAFTIVELLIVIVVIAILAAITIIAYTGIQDRAKQAALQSAASQASKKILAYAALNTDLFPPDEATFFSSTNLQDTSDTDYTYLTSPDRTHYCISATNPNNPTLSTAVSDTSSGTVEGRCVRNLIANPGFEANVGIWTQPNATTAQSTVWTAGGSYSMRLAPNSSTNADSYTSYMVYLGSAINQIVASEPYNFSATFYQSAPQNSSPIEGRARQLVSYSWNGSTPSSLPTSAQPANVAGPTRLSAVLTVQQAGASRLDARLYNGAVNTSQNYVYWDNVMLTKGATLYAYGDGSSPGWSWDGTPNASTSFGPAKL